MTRPNGDASSTLAQAERGPGRPWRPPTLSESIWAGWSFLRVRREFLLSLLVAGIAWEVIGRTADLFFLPPLSSVLIALWTLIVDGTLPSQLVVSLSTLVVGVVIASIAGIAVGALMGLFRSVEEALDIYLSAAMSAPMVAFIPLFILAFGIGYPTRLLIVVLFAFFPVAINTFAGIRNPEASLVEMGRSFGATPRQLFWRVRIPMAFPYLQAGLTLSTARGVDGLIAGEVLIASVGLGRVVTRYANAFTMDRLYAVAIFIAFVALVAVGLVNALTRRLVRQ
jgi:NitT/TauT family transport system permease protein